MSAGSATVAVLSTDRIRRTAIKATAGKRRHRQPFLHAEHPCEDVVVHAALEQRAGRHIEEALPDPGDPQEE